MVRIILKVTLGSLMVSLLFYTGTDKAGAWFHHPVELGSLPVFENNRLDNSLSGVTSFCQIKVRLEAGFRESNSPMMQPV